VEEGVKDAAAVNVPILSIASGHDRHLLLNPSLPIILNWATTNIYPIRRRDEMKSLLWCTVLLASLSALAISANPTCGAAEPKQRMLSHDVYFTLKHDSEEARATLVAACQKYLSGHPGTVWFAAGMIAEELRREVNDLDFDVALHIVFKDKASHDKYQDSPKHHKFIEEFSESWETVRVFDSWCDATSHGDVDMEPVSSGKPRLPDAATSFAGMIEGEVLAKGDGEIVVAVKKVLKVWKNSRAEMPQSLVGKRVLVQAPDDDNRHRAMIARFLDGLDAGETVGLDVAHPGKGEGLRVLELTPEQRERVKE
jgi:hypothetical protein